MNQGSYVDMLLCWIYPHFEVEIPNVSQFGHWLVRFLLFGIPIYGNCSWRVRSSNWTFGCIFCLWFVGGYVASKDGSQDLWSLMSHRSHKHSQDEFKEIMSNHLPPLPTLESKLFSLVTALVQQSMCLMYKTCMFVAFFRIGSSLELSSSLQLIIHLTC